MKDYTRLLDLCKRELVRFGGAVTQGVKRPEKKLIHQILYGLMASQSCHLTKIGRALWEKISLKKTEERLSRGLGLFDRRDQVMKNYVEMIKPQVSERALFIIDGSDITKPCSKALEGLCKVHDGSTGVIKDGYPTVEIAVLSRQHKMPIPVYSSIYSYEQDAFVSATEETLSGLRWLTQQFGSTGIRVMDRGYDAAAYYDYFFQNAELFVIRCKKTRNVLYQDKPYNILELAQKRRGKYRLDFTDKLSGKTLHCKVGIVPVRLPDFPDHPVQLVVVYGLGDTPLMLLSNMSSSDSRLALAISKVYLLRWRIEEFFRFKKQQFDFEDFRVRSLRSITNLNMILTLLIALIALLSERAEDHLFPAKLVEVANRISQCRDKSGKLKLLFYAIADAFFDILNKSRSGPPVFLPKPSLALPRQLAFL